MDGFYKIKWKEYHEDEIFVRDNESFEEAIKSHIGMVPDSMIEFTIISDEFLRPNEPDSMTEAKKEMEK
jgi:hypothetical protein